MKPRALLEKLTELAVRLQDCKDDAEKEALRHERELLLKNVDLLFFSLNKEDTGYDELDDMPFILEEDLFTENGKTGIRATSQHCGLPAEYDRIQIMTDSNVVMVWKQGKIGRAYLYEQFYQWAFPPEYDQAEEIPCDVTDRWILKQGDKYRYLFWGSVSEKFDAIRLPRIAGWIRVLRGDEWGWMDAKLRFTADYGMAHEFLWPQETDWLLVPKRPASREDINACSDLDAEGADMEQIRKITDPIYEHSGGEPFLENGKWGYRDSLGAVLMPCQFDHMEKDGAFLLTRKEGRWEIWSDVHHGIPICYARSDEKPWNVIDDAHWCVNEYGKYYLVSVGPNDVVTTGGFDKVISDEESPYILIKRQGRWGFADFRHTIFPVYKDIWCQRPLSFVRFKKDDTWGYVDSKGQWTEDIHKADVYVRQDSLKDIHDESFLGSEH